MNGYLLKIMGTVLLCALFTAILPDGKTSSVIKSMTRLACVLIIVAPILSFFKSGTLEDLLEGNEEDFFAQSVIREDTEFIQYYSELRVQETQKALEEELSNKYSIAAKVELYWRMEVETFADVYATENIRVEGIRVETQGEVQEEIKQEVWRYLTKNYCSEVLIE